MKKISLAIVLALSSMLVMAQQQQHSCNSYTRLTAGFSGMQMYSGADDTAYDTDMFSPGVVIGVSWGKNITYPAITRGALYFEAGPELAYNTGSHTTDAGKSYEVKTRLNLMSASLPIDLCYKLPFNAGKNNFFVRAGISPKANIVAELETHSMSERVNGVIIVGGHKVGTTTEKASHDKTIDMLSKDAMGEDFVAERFQIAAHGGVGFEFGNVAIGYKFGADLSPFQSYSLGSSHVRTITMSHTVSISYIFKQ